MNEQALAINTDVSFWNGSCLKRLTVLSYNNTDRSEQWASDPLSHKKYENSSQ